MMMIMEKKDTLNHPHDYLISIFPSNQIGDYCPQ